MKNLPLPKSFFERNPNIVARGLLGKVLVRRSGDVLISGKIVETEAYLGEGDAAAHAAAGNTPRNAVLFGPAGHAYVYFTYGMHYCMNVSCEPEGQAGCVLLRALEPIDGIATMAKARKLVRTDSIKELKSLTSGPARLCQALHITRNEDNGKDLTSLNSDLVIVSGFEPAKIKTSTRIGISKSKELQLRFFLVGNPYVSAVS